MANRRADPTILHRPITRRHFLRGATLAVGGALAGAFPGEAEAKEGILWYSGSSARSVNAWLRAFTKKTGIPGEFFRTGGVRLAQKFEAEIQAGQVKSDVIDISIPGLMTEWAKKGYLMAYESPEAKHFPRELRYPPYWTPIKALVLPIAYNADLVKPDEAPKSWEDLLDPKWKGKLVVADILYSGAALHWYGAVRATFGKKFVERLSKQNVLVKRGHGSVVATMVSGERPVALEMLLYRVFAGIRKGANLRVVIPEDGIPATYEVIAIPAAARNKEGAKRFVDFALSREAQTLWQEKFDIPVLRDDVKPLTRVRGRRPLSEIKFISSTADDIARLFPQQRMLMAEWKRLFK